MYCDTRTTYVLPVMSCTLAARHHQSLLQAPSPCQHGPTHTLGQCVFPAQGPVAHRASPWRSKATGPRIHITIRVPKGDQEHALVHAARGCTPHHTSNNCQRRQLTCCVRAGDAAHCYAQHQPVLPLPSHPTLPRIVSTRISHPDAPSACFLAHAPAEA